MLNTRLIKSYTDLRLDPASIAKLASDSGPVYIFHRNNPTSVMIDVDDYEQMVEELLDSRDSVWLKQNEAKFKKSRGVTSDAIRRKYNLTK
jgi:PHD/YefM family antitoxin component YafN of YafNO toxin-antitoxin module